jgi:hypothetical protein
MPADGPNLCRSCLQIIRLALFMRGQTIFTQFPAIGGLETGVRQLIRSEPLESQIISLGSGTIKVPTENEILRIKAILILKRNATRDYLDFAALADHLGGHGVAAALSRFDELYPQENNQSPIQQLMVQLSDPRPYDLGKEELKDYKSLAPRWHDWNNVVAACSAAVTAAFNSQPTSVLSASPKP